MTTEAEAILDDAQDQLHGYNIGQRRPTAIEQWHHQRRQGFFGAVLVYYQPAHTDGPHVKYLYDAADAWSWLRRQHDMHTAILGAWTSSGYDLEH